MLSTITALYTELERCEPHEVWPLLAKDFARGMAVAGLLIAVLWGALVMIGEPM